MRDLLTDAEPPVTVKEMADEAKREVELRERVYPRMIKAGRLNPGAAARQIAVMKAAAAYLVVKAMEES